MGAADNAVRLLSFSCLFFLDFLARSLVLARALTAFCSAVMTLEQAPPRPEDARGWGGGLAPVAEEKEVKVVVVDEPPPARLQAQRPLAPLQVTTHAPPPPMSVATGNVEPPPAYQPVMQPPQQVGNWEMSIFLDSRFFPFFLPFEKGKESRLNWLASNSPFK
jgi:hypothetical protein